MKNNGTEIKPRNYIPKVITVCQENHNRSWITTTTYNSSSGYVKIVHWKYKNNEKYRTNDYDN